VNDQVDDREEPASNDSSPPEEPIESPPGPPAQLPERPNLQGFDRWIQKRLIPTLGSVIVIAFLFKSFVPVPYGFTVGLLTGLVLLIVIYLIDTYRRR
jgi:hypothetical protein